MASKRPGRPSKHDWSDKRDICYKLYVDEGKSVKEIIDYFTSALGVDASQVPSARDFTRQFSRWHFPPRREKLSAEDEARLAERIKQLWEANCVQQQMLDTLASEGWQLDQNALARFRRKHGVMLRVAAGYNRDNMGPGTGKKRKRTALDEAETTLTDLPRGSEGDTTVADRPQVESVSHMDTAESGIVVAPEEADSGIVVASGEAGSGIVVAPEEAARRMQRLVDIQTNSDAQFNTRKRRRRIRGYAHLPPDAPGLPPRYKSETSLDECKAYLNLSNERYREVRQNFEDICNEMDIIKKRLCNDGDWEKAKTRLIRESIHLSAVLNPVHDNLAERENALEVVCADVTKRMRTMKKRIFVKQANNILGLNPEQSKELRRRFYEILKADHFQTMLMCGKEHWQELKQQWYDGSELVQQLYAQGLDEEKKRCIDVLLRDAMKRHNDNNVSKIPHLSQQNASYGPGPGPARRTKNNEEQVASQGSVPVPTAQSHRDPPRHADLDPALFVALNPGLTAASPASATQQLRLPNTIPAYFRLSADSRLAGPHPKMWLSALDRPDISSLHNAAKMKTTSGEVTRISGVVKSADGHEDQYQIDGDDELEAYLEAIKEFAAGKATFVVVLDQATA